MVCSREKVKREIRERETRAHMEGEPSNPVPSPSKNQQNNHFINTFDLPCKRT
ncbi:hypothetical protein Hanom_Chr05g00447551 [Helianthus anomalus]